MKKLEVGDIIFSSQYSNKTKFGVIDRVTEKYAFVGNTKFNREVDERYFNSIPRERWNTTSYFIPTEEDIKKYNLKNKIYFIQKFNYSELTEEKINKIYEILKTN